MAQHNPWKRDGEPVAERENIALTEAETMAATQVANWYAACCHAAGRPAPPDRLRCLLELGMGAYLAAHAEREDDGEDDVLVLPPPTVQ